MPVGTAYRAQMLADTIKHVHETLQLLSVVTEDRRFEDVYNNKIGGGEDVTMCEVLDRIEDKGYTRGLEIGLEQGENRFAELSDF